MMAAGIHPNSGSVGNIFVKRRVPMWWSAPSYDCTAPSSAVTFQMTGRFAAPRSRLVGTGSATSVTAVTLVADPVPTKRDLGAANRPVIWNVTAELGAVQSYDGADHHMGTRRFTKMLPTDPEFGWIPAAIIASLQ